MKQNETLNIQQLNEFCTQLAKNISEPTLITLEGNLGSGKTQFTNFLVSALTNKEISHSPTFSIINEYKGWELPIFHIDLYRLESQSDLESTGFWDLFDEEALIIIEWSNLLEDSYYPQNWPRKHFNFAHIEGETNKRQLTLRT